LDCREIALAATDPTSRTIRRVTSTRIVVVHVETNPLQRRKNGVAAVRSLSVALVEHDRVVQAREQPHGSQTVVAAYVRQRVVRHRGQVRFEAVGREELDQLAQRFRPRRVRVLQRGHVDDHALRPARRPVQPVAAVRGLAVDHGHGHGRRAIGRRHRRDHLPLERVPVDHVQAARVPHDLGVRHFGRVAVRVQPHVQIGVGQPADQVHVDQHALDEHEQQRRHHARQQPGVDVQHDDGHVRDHPHRAVRLGVPPYFRQVERLQHDALQGHHHYAREHAPRERLEDDADPEQHDHDDGRGHDAGHLRLAADRLLRGATGRRRAAGQAREERADHVAQALGEQLLVAVQRVFQFLRHEQCQRHGDGVRDQGDRARVHEHRGQQLQRRHLEARQTRFDLAHLRDKCTPSVH